MTTEEFTPNPLPDLGPPSASEASSLAAMESHQLTVSSTASGTRGDPLNQVPSSVPFLRLRGRWLDRAGFTIGAKVHVLTAPGRLVIEIAKDMNPAPLSYGVAERGSRRCPE
jgi:toxic protein SymE